MLEVKNICYDAGEFSLKSVSFRVEKGDYFILLGESGAGKSMLLETIAGLVHPDSGSLVLEGNDITRARIQNRKIGLVFQDHAVFPHMTVYENISYSLHGKKINNREKKARVNGIAELLSISGLLERRPATLSGGELQRVALARTLIQRPKILLLDEPLASLDSRIKSELRSLLRKIHHQGQTILHVTHDYEEALSLGNRIAVIHQGSVIQEGTPEEVFRNPKSEFVAHFTGARNFFRAHGTGENNNSIALLENTLPVTLLPLVNTPDGFILIRSEDILLSNEPFDSSAANNFEGTVAEIIPGISGTDVVVNTGISLHALVTPESVSRLEITEGKKIWIHFKATAVKFIPA
ncbi:MAG: ATP-binding cassette domain-containing protein [Bacteroidetes bacterium]|nr:ATP-binding cassette domain-containing protein [Bacteroidota bacterium]